MHPDDEILQTSPEIELEDPAVTVLTVVDEVLNGIWGEGVSRIIALKQAGYDPVAVMAEVNRQNGA